MTAPESTRLAELNALLTHGDLSRLTRRLLDYMTDHTLPQELRGEIVALRAAYNEQAQAEQAALPAELSAPLQQRAAACMARLNALAGQTEAKPDKLGAPVMEAADLLKSFRLASHAFQLGPVSLVLRAGEITGVVGENGNGKTTLLRIAAGELAPDNGDLQYPGINETPDDWYAIRQHIAFIPQQLSPWHGPLRENLHFSAALCGILGKANEELVHFVVQRLGLSRYEHAHWREISSGYKLRFELARALVRRPRLLVIDEPLANLDINAQQVFLQDLRDLAHSRQYPMAVLLSSQHLYEVERVADQLLFLQQGQPRYSGSVRGIGEGRLHNVFELAADAPAAAISACLSTLPGLKIEDNGKWLLVQTAPEAGAAEVLKCLLQAGIVVNYFRDISASSARLFRELARPAGGSAQSASR